MDKLEKILKSRTVRPTTMRLLVLKFLLQNKVAVSLTNIEEYFDIFERTTLFRTLKIFEENGIVHQIDDGTGTTKYAVCEENCNCELEQDLYLHCNNCDETVCLTEYKIPHINLLEGYLAENVNLVIKGICEKYSGY